MSQSEATSEAAIERLKREIASDRARVAFAMRHAKSGKLLGETRIGRLYEVFEATGQSDNHGLRS
jgi:hypothetical protein